MSCFRHHIAEKLLLWQSTITIESSLRYMVGFKSRIQCNIPERRTNYSQERHAISQTRHQSRQPIIFKRKANLYTC